MRFALSIVCRAVSRWFHGAFSSATMPLRRGTLVYICLDNEQHSDIAHTDGNIRALRISSSYESAHRIERNNENPVPGLLSGWPRYFESHQ